MRRQTPTIKDVARHAGVSAMTVSRVCNPSPEVSISEVTRERVLESIRELGYSPDALAQSVRRGRTGTVGFYNGYRGLFTIDDDFPRSIFDGLQDASTALSQDLLLFHVPEHARLPAEVVQELNTSKVDGVVFLPQEGDEELARLLGESHKSVIGIAEALPGLPAITAQDADGSRRLAQHLFERGHRRILYRKSRTDLVSAGRRYDAFCKTAAALGMDVEPMVPTRLYDALDADERRRIAECRRNGFTAIIGWHDNSAMSVLVACLEEGLRVPEDVAVAGFDRLPPRICPPGVDLTTIEVDWSKIARMAVEHIVNGVDGLSDRLAEASIDCPLHVGNTT